MGFSENGKLVRHDEYNPYEGSQPAFIVDGGQRKSSITSYPNAGAAADGLNNYVVKTERVVELVRPVVTRRVLVNGNPVREERIVGAYEHGGNGLKENLENLGKVKDFFSQVQLEASMQAAAPILSRPAKPNWPSQNGGARGRPNWGSRAAWVSRDDSPPRYGGGGEHFEVNNRPNAGIMSTYNTSYDDSPPRFNQRRPNLSHPSLGTKPIWPSRADSPLRVMVNSGSRPKWPSNRDDSPPRRMVRPEPMAHPGSKPNWSIRHDSPPRTMEYYESYPNSNTKPNWPKARDDSPTRTVEYYESQPNSNTRPNWAKARGDSSPRSMMHPELSHPNSGTRPNWSIRDDSPPRAMKYYESQPKSNARPNWTKARDDSPPKSMIHHPMARPNSDANKPNWPSNRDDDSPPRSMMHLELSHPNSGTRPNWSIQDDSPPNNSRAMKYYESLSKSNTRPNWENARDHSPPRSMVHSGFGHPNSDTMPNWHDQDDSPKYAEKGKDQRNTSPLHTKLEKVNIHGTGGSSPTPNKMNAAGSNVIKPATIDVPEGYSNQPVKKGNSNSSQQVRESDQKPNWPNRKPQDGNKEEYEKPKSIKKGNEEEIIHHGFDNHPKSVAFEDTTTQKVEDYPYKKPSNNLDDGNSKKMSNTKPNFNGGWYNKQPTSTLTSATSNVDDLMKVIEEAKRTGAYPAASEMPHWSEITPIPPQGARVSSTYSTVSAPQWNEITPNPPHELLTQPAIDSTEARRRYSAYPQPVVAAAPMGYFGALSSEDALRKYGGTKLPNMDTN